MTVPLRGIPRSLLAGDAPEVAPRLLWSVLEVEGVAGRIIEVEAYTSNDPASHSSRGRSRRNATMFGAAGSLYVYSIYGIHLCANVVTGPTGDGQAVLIRAIAPITGIDVIRQRRGGRPDRHLTNGPGKLCEALAIRREDDGTDVCDPHARIRLLSDGTPPPVAALAGPRIGISAATEVPWNWRLQLAGSPASRLRGVAHAHQCSQ